MVSQAKIYAVDNLAAKLKEAEAFFLVNYQGLLASDLGKLRQQVRESGGELLVIKNSLLARAVEKAGNFTDWHRDSLKGPTACLLDKKGNLSSLKLVAKALEKEGALKGGVLKKEAVFLSGEQVEELAKLPGYDELMGKLVGSLKGINSSFVSILGGPMRQFVFLLKAIKNKNDKTEEVKN